MSQQENKIKLNLGCGSKHIPGFINVDTRDEANPDVKSDLFNLTDHFKDGSISLIYACHVLEHFSRKEIDILLPKWRKLLDPFRGKLRLSVPDFKSIVKFYQLTDDLSKLQTLLYGGHKYDQDYHYIAFDFNSLEKLLKSHGFNEIKTYDWKKTEHSYVDDYSQAYLPHMDKVNGMLMSLNVEAEV